MHGSQIQLVETSFFSNFPVALLIGLCAAVLFPECRAGLCLDLDEGWMGALASPSGIVASVDALSADAALPPAAVGVSVVVRCAPSAGPFHPGAGPM